MGFSEGFLSIFEKGGIMTGRGSLPLNRYAGGGVANTPQLAMFGEGRKPEAYVPLPDGRSIPVKMQGNGQPVVINQSINFSTGVVPTVRAEVMNMMPMIKEVTAAAVQDKRMRNPAFFGNTAR